MRAFWVVLFLWCCASAAEDGPVKIGPRVGDAAAWGIGESVADLPLKFLDGPAGKLSDYSLRAALVVATIAPDCPVSQKYLPRLAELQKKYDAQHVEFLLLNSSGDAPAMLRTALKRSGLALPVVLDDAAELAQALHAKVTTDVFVLDPGRKLVYRGAIDDQYGIGYERDAASRNYLGDALDAVLAHRAVATAATLAPGCELTFPARPAVASSGAAVTFHNTISRLMQNNCQQCHRPGGVGPFPLQSYNEVKKKANVIRRVTSTRVMPPWFADNSIGHAWANNRRLSDGDLKSLLEWIDAKCPEGEAKDAPPPRVWEKGAEDWNIGTPDAIVQIPQPVKLPAQGTMPYQYIKVQTNFTEDKWVQAVELLPTNPAVVHHAQVFVVTAEGKELSDPTPTNGGRPTSYFAAMVPGETALVFPAGYAKLLPRGCSLTFEVHYVPNGAPASDQIRVGMVFARTAPKFEVKSFDIRTNNLLIKPGDANYSQSTEYTFETPARLLAFQPHMHLRGKAFSFDLILPDGRTEPVLSVPRYDFNWQTSYRLKEPWDIPKGSRLRVTGWYDNSKDNPANPDPTKTIRAGGETTDEMLVGFGEWCARTDE